MMTEIPSSSICNWLDLPDHILYLIADKVIRQKDFIRFGAVCQSWQSVYADIVRTRCRSRKLPLLMLGTEYCSRKLPTLMLATENYKDDQTRSFYNLRDQTVFDAQVQIPHNMHCLGSSHGWLVTVCPQTFQVRLFNPFLSSNNEILLPPLTTFQYAPKPEYLSPGFLHKAVLSTNPSSDPNNYVLMAIYYGCGKGDRLAFYKPGDNTWTSLDSQPGDNTRTSLDSKFYHIEDVIYYRDQFYFVNHHGKVFSFDFNHQQEAPIISTVALHPPEPEARADKRYLVESSGDLLQVIRYMHCDELTKYYDFDDPIGYYCNNGFDVFKLDVIEQTWVNLDNLGGRMLFLGDNSSISLSASDFTECKPNCIYFTDDNYSGFDKNAEECKVGGHDMGVYDLEKDTRDTHYPIDDDDVTMIFPRPVWIEPPPLLGLSVNSGVGGISKKYMEASIFDYEKI